MPTTAGRRTLTFATLDQVMPDVDRLLARGYTRVGRWTLGHVCNHLSKALIDAVDGSKIKPPWILRAVVGPWLIKGRVLKTGVIPEGFKSPAAMSPPEGVDDRAEVEALRAAVQFYRSHVGPFPRHPMFGTLTDAERERIHCIHSAHHLSFLVPNVEGSSVASSP